MIPGITAYGGLPSSSAPVAFKGVATYTATSHLEIFQDNGTTWTSVFDLTDSQIRTIELVANDLLVVRTAAPYIRVYSWNGTTFVQTWAMSTVPFGSNIPSGAAAISFDGNRLMYSGQGANAPYGTAGVGTMTRQGDGSYAAESWIDVAITNDSIATNGDGTVLFARRNSNTTAGMARYSSGAWGSFAGVGSAPFGNNRPSASSRTGTSIYMSTLSTSSPYLCMYRHIVSTGANSRLSNFSTLPPSTWTNTSTDMSYDGTYVALGYQAGTTANGGIRVYSRTSATAFNNISLDTGAIVNGNIVGVSFSSDGTKLYGARAFTGTTSENVWVWTRSGSTWTQTGSIKCNSYFAQSNSERRLISAN